ncbi:hypothetical protein L1987_48051 [Smallanthus sonchifolius]|uniref:Uncharacterized protein n=1 Tax=Smallanthus sonchifolius TaxID=185202 RepID=A0ACB9FRS8_9ASTR|nr:hypothetical protein L1987_48051 [Smallanthus sonchifolius]
MGTDDGGSGPSNKKGGWKIVRHNILESAPGTLDNIHDDSVAVHSVKTVTGAEVADQEAKERSSRIQHVSKMLKYWTAVSKGQPTATHALKGFKFIGPSAWNALDKRFDELTKESDGLLQRSRFGECIGMNKDSNDFAEDLFDSLCRRRNITGDKINKAKFKEFWEEIANQSFDSRLQIFLDMVDKDKDGRITEDEVRTTGFGLIDKLEKLLKGAATRNEREKQLLSESSRQHPKSTHGPVIAVAIAIGVGLHAISHLACDFRRLIHATEEEYKPMQQFFGDQTKNYWHFVKEVEGYTGIIMVVLMTIAFTLAWLRQGKLKPPSVFKKLTRFDAFKNSKLYGAFVTKVTGFLGSLNKLTGFNAFWYSHHLFVIVYALLIVHGIKLYLTKDWYKKTVTAYPGGVLALRVTKPKNFKYKSGEYMFVKCAAVSPFECIPKVKIDGPYGAPAQDYKNYEVVLLVGLGIGATPMISIVKDIVNSMKANEEKANALEDGATLQKNNKLGPTSANDFRTKRAYFYWVTKEQESFDWFEGVMNEVAEIDKYSVIEVHNYCTSVFDEGDARSALITMLQSLNHAKNGVDVVSGTRVKSHFAKPRWRDVYSRIAANHTGSDIG